MLNLLQLKGLKHVDVGVQSTLLPCRFKLRKKSTVKINFMENTCTNGKMNI